MKSDDRGPYHQRASRSDGWRGVLGLRSATVSFITSLRLPNSNRRTPLDALKATGTVLTPWRTSRCGSLAGRHHRPDDPGKLVGQRHRDQPCWLLGQKRAIQSRRAPLRLPATRSTEVAPSTSSFLMYRLPCLVMAPSFSLPPLEFCLGVRPSQAAKSRPDLNTLGSGTLATITEAMILPTPGTCSPAICSSHFAHEPSQYRLLERVDRLRRCPSRCSARTFTAALAVCGSVASSLRQFRAARRRVQFPWRRPCRIPTDARAAR